MTDGASQSQPGGRIVMADAAAAQVLLIGAGWEQLADGPGEALKLLKKLPLLRLMPSGYVVVWASKWNLHPLWRWLTGFNFRLVENMAWVCTPPPPSWSCICRSASWLGVTSARRPACQCLGPDEQAALCLPQQGHPGRGD